MLAKKISEWTRNGVTWHVYAIEYCGKIIYADIPAHIHALDWIRKMAPALIKSDFSY